MIPPPLVFPGLTNTLLGQFCKKYFSIDLFQFRQRQKVGGGAVDAEEQQRATHVGPAGGDDIKLVSVVTDAQPK